MSSPLLETAIGDVEMKNHDAKVDDDNFRDTPWTHATPPPGR